MDRVVKVIAFVLFIGLKLSSANLQAESWHRIGMEKVDRKTETDTISVKKGERFRFIKLSVLDSGIVIERWVLEYRDGSRQHVGFFGFFPAGKESPPIPLRGQLKKVHFKYHTETGRKKAKVVLLGS